MEFFLISHIRLIFQLINRFPRARARAYFILSIYNIFNIFNIFKGRFHLTVRFDSVNCEI